MSRFKLDSELSEKQIEADVSNYFGWISPNHRKLPYRLLDINEQQTGADKQFDCVIPIYTQFKVSHGLNKISDYKIIRKISGSSSLQRIRKFRYDEDLYDNPTLYFKLREKAKTANDFQHNILKRLDIANRSHAFYVAPLTLKKKEYEDSLYRSDMRYIDFPFHYDELEIRFRRSFRFFNAVPFLRGHISIPLVVGSVPSFFKPIKNI